MRFDCEDLRERLNHYPLIVACDIVGNGDIRIATPFKYPDGSLIDLFVSLPNVFGNISISDQGQTFSYLLDLHVRPSLTRRRQQIVADVCRTYDIHQEGSELKVVLQDARIEEMPQIITNLAQACIRISDLGFTQRFRAVNAFDEDFEEFLESTELQYDVGVPFIGSFNNEITVDYQVKGRNVVSLIEVFSTANGTAAHNMTNEIFRKWFDLRSYRENSQFITVYDSTFDVYRRDDMSRLESYSLIFGFPAQQSVLKEALAA